VATGVLCLLVVVSCSDEAPRDDEPGRSDQAVATTASGTGSETAAASGSSATTDADTNPDPTTDFGGYDGADTPEPTCTPAPEGTTVVDPRPDWDQVDERRLTHQRLRVDSRSTGPEVSGVTPARLSVVDADATGWELVWESERTIAEALELPPELVAQAVDLIDEVPQQRVSYRLDRASRRWLGVTNAEELRADVETTFGFLADSGQFAAGTLDDMSSAFAAMPDEGLALVFAQSMQAFHALEGVELEVGQPVEGPNESPNPVGGSPFPARSTVEITELIDVDGCVSIELRTEIDGEQALPLIMSSVRQLFPELEADTEQDQAELDALARSFDLEHLIVGQYDPGTGFFHRVTATRRIDNGVDHQANTIIITDVT
jgi:hypothetical protein